MIVGCGIDIEETGRFDYYFNNDPVFLRLVEDIFSKKEIKLNNKFKNRLAFSIGFSCKEAMLKAFGKGWLNGNINWKNIELLFSDKDKYKIRLNSSAKKFYKEKKAKTIESEYSFLEGHVVFKVIIISE